MATLFRKLVGWSGGILEYWAHHSIIPLFYYSILILAIAILLLPLKSFSAETVKFKHVQSIYFDEKGGSIKQPEGVACNEKSFLIIGDTGNDRLLQYSYENRNLKAGAEIKVPQLSNPIRVQFNSKGEIFALDGKKRRILRLAPGGEFKDYLEPGGMPSPSTFVPRSFKIDRNDNIFILDIFLGRVIVLSPDGKYQKQIPFPKDYGFFSDLTIDAKGSVLLIDSVKAMVFSAGKDSNSFTALTKDLRENLNFPTSITTDDRGTIYLVDENGSGIVILGQDGSFLGRQLTMGWNEGLLYYPTQMCLNAKGEAFIADRGNSRVQIFTLVK
jgi:NHL repeat